MQRYQQANMTSNHSETGSQEAISQLKAKVLSLESLLVLSDQRNELQKQNSQKLENII